MCTEWGVFIVYLLESFCPVKVLICRKKILQEKSKEFRKKGGDVAIETLDGRGLVAVQGI